MNKSSDWEIYMESATDGTGKFFHVNRAEMGQLTDQSPGNSTQRYIRDPNSGREIFVNDIIQARTPSTIITLPEDDADWIRNLSLLRCTTAIQRVNKCDGIIHHLSAVRVNGTTLTNPTASGINAVDAIPQETLPILFAKRDIIDTSPASSRGEIMDDDEETIVVGTVYCSCGEGCDTPSSYLYRAIQDSTGTRVQLSYNGGDWENLTFAGMDGNWNRIDCVNGFLVMTDTDRVDVNIAIFDTSLCDGDWEYGIVVDPTLELSNVSGNGTVWITAAWAAGGVLTIIRGTSNGYEWQIVNESALGEIPVTGEEQIVTAVAGQTFAVGYNSERVLPDLVPPHSELRVSDNSGAPGTWVQVDTDPFYDQFIRAIAVAIPDQLKTRQGVVAVATNTSRIYKARVTGCGEFGCRDISWRMTHDYCVRHGSDGEHYIYLSLSHDGRMTRWARTVDSTLHIESDFGSLCSSESFYPVNQQRLATCPGSFGDYWYSVVQPVAEITIVSNFEVLGIDGGAEIMVLDTNGRLVASGITDGFGEFVVSLPFGGYMIRASRTDYDWDYYGTKAMSIEDTTPQTVTVNLYRTNVLIEMLIRGTTCAPLTWDNTNLTQVIVYKDNQHFATTFTDKNGILRMRIAPGNYKLYVPPWLAPAGGEFSGELVLPLERGDYYNTTWTLPIINIHVCGLVRDWSSGSPVPIAAEITARTPDGTVVGIGASDSGGSFVMSLPAGEEILLCAKNTASALLKEGSETVGPAAGLWGPDIAISINPGEDVHVFFTDPGIGLTPVDSYDFTIQRITGCLSLLYNQSGAGNTFTLQPATFDDYFFAGTGTIGGNTRAFAGVVSYAGGTISIEIP